LIVPLPQGPMASWNVGEAVVDPGIVTEADSDVGQLVSEPTGTSENWYANCAVEEGATETDDGDAFAALETETVRPLTIVTVSGAPLPEKSARVG
jgi:hypothetical protein